AINYTYVITPSVVNRFIGSALWYSAYFGPANVAASQKLFPTAFFFNDGGANGGGFYQMGSSWNSFPQGRDVGQAQLTDDLSITRGRHTIKVGENFRRNRVSDFGLLSGTTGYSTFDSLADLPTAISMRVSAATISRIFLRFLPPTSACIISASPPRTSGRLP